MPTSIETDIRSLKLASDIEGALLAKVADLKSLIASATTRQEEAIQEELTRQSVIGDEAQALHKSALEASKARIAELETTVSIITAERDTLMALKDTFTQQVAAVLQSRDPAQYEALAAEFLTPEVEKKRAELIARKAAIDAELEALPQSK